MITIKKKEKVEELNLDGYKHIKNNDWSVPGNLIVWLQDHNFEEVGSGKYSKVFSSNTESFIVKMNKGSIDEEYLEFVNFCLANKGNPHLPKIGKPKMLDDWYIIFIEKLEKRDIEKIGISEYSFFSIMKDLTSVYLDGSEEDVKNKWNSIKEVYPKADEQLLIIAKLMSQIINSCPNITIKNFDLHDENVMMRGGTIVITDPFWEGSGW